MTTTVLAMPLLIGANATAAHSEDPFGQFPVGITTMLVGGAGISTLGVASLTALRSLPHLPLESARSTH
jgi:hypothetical protein